jgi:hypothetical protein
MSAVPRTSRGGKSLGRRRLNFAGLPIRKFSDLFQLRGYDKACSKDEESPHNSNCVQRLLSQDKESDDGSPHWNPSEDNLQAIPPKCPLSHFNACQHTLFDGYNACQHTLFDGYNACQHTLFDGGTSCLIESSTTPKKGSHRTTPGYCQQYLKRS